MKYVQHVSNNHRSPGTFLPNALSFWPRYTGSRSLSGCSYLLITKTLRRQEWPHNLPLADPLHERPPGCKVLLLAPGWRGRGYKTRRPKSKGRATFPAQGWKKERCVQMYSLCLCVCVCAHCSLMQYCSIKGGGGHWKVKTGAAFPGALFALGMLWL